ncbi:MAG: NUDIX hydrolase [Bacteroidia bacterium]
MKPPPLPEKVATFPHRVLWQAPPIFQAVEIQFPWARRYLICRGNYVAIAIHLQNIHTKESYFLLAAQQRPASGDIFYEHPAGLIDPGETPLQAALRELSEETPLTAQEKELVPLTSEGLYSSPGILDEKGYFYALHRTLPPEKIQALHHRRTGVGDEAITLQVVPFATCIRSMRNLQTIAHTLLYWQYIGYVPPHPHNRAL